MEDPVALQIANDQLRREAEHLKQAVSAARASLEHKEHAHAAEEFRLKTLLSRDEGELQSLRVRKCEAVVEEIRARVLLSSRIVAQREAFVEVARQAWMAGGGSTERHDVADEVEEQRKEQPSSAKKRKAQPAESSKEQEEDDDFDDDDDYKKVKKPSSGKKAKATPKKAGNASATQVVEKEKIKIVKPAFKPVAESSLNFKAAFNNKNNVPKVRTSTG